MNAALLAIVGAVADSQSLSWASAASVAAGGLVGLSLGLTGGGGAIFAVPLLVYWIGVDPRTAGPRFFHRDRPRRDVHHLQDHAAAKDACIKACNECLRACRECIVGCDCPSCEKTCLTCIDSCRACAAACKACRDDDDRSDERADKQSSHGTRLREWALPPPLPSRVCWAGSGRRRRAGNYLWSWSPCGCSANSPANGVPSTAPLIVPANSRTMPRLSCVPP